MKIIDSHQHFWKYDPVNYDWINDDMQVIRRDFLPADLELVYKENQVQGCIAVQAEQTEAETKRLICYADEHDFIEGIVGWTDLRSETIEERLSYYSQHKKLKGFRHVLQGEEPAFMLQPSFLNGISKLHSFGFTYDILIFPHHLDAALELVKQFPQQPFVIDHLAKPYIKDKKTEAWKKGMEALAACSNVACKISGMVTEADWNNWTAADLKPYLDVVTACFGTNRLMFGSDWPVCLVASSYSRWLQTVKDYFADIRIEERHNIFAENAIRFYKL
jgi:L-fuconolactonase